MKKILLILLVFAGLTTSAQHLRPSNYTSVNQRYLWEAGLFNALGIPTGTSAEFRSGQAVRAGALYYDSTGIDSGLYVYSGLSWQKAGSSLDTTSLSNRINLKVNISDTAAMLAPYLYNANEGLSVSGKYAQFGGPLGTASPLLTNRQIDLNDKLLYFTRGVPTPDYTAFDDRYTPFNVHIIDSVTSDAPDFDVVGKSGGNFHRTIRYYPPGYKVFNRYGWRMALETQVGDSVIEPSVGGDYYAALIAEHQISPLADHTGRSVVRSGHGGFSYNFAHEGIPTFLANVFFDGTDATKYIYYKGFLTGIRPYLVMANGATDTVENMVYYAGSSFVNTPSWVKRSFVLRPEATHNRVAQPFFLYDSTRRERSFHAGNFALGPGVDSSDYKLDVRGTGRFSDSLTLSFATNTADTTGYDVVLRRRSDGTITRVSASQLLAFGGVGGSPLLPTTGTGTATGNVTGDLDGNEYLLKTGATELDKVASTYAERTSVSGGAYVKQTQNAAGGQFWEVEATDGSKSSILRVGRFGTPYEISLTTDTLKVNLQGNDNIKSIADSGNYYFMLVEKGSGAKAIGKTHWPVPGGGSTDTTSLSNRIDAKISTTTTNPAHTGTTPSGTGVIGATMFARLTSNHSLADNTTDQPIAPSGFDVWTLQGNTTYEVEGLYHINMGTTTHLTQMGFTLGGGASVTSILYDATSWTNAPGTGQTAQYTILSNVATATTVSLFDGAATKTVRFKGMISMNAGGTVTPFVKFSVAPGGTNEMVAGSYIKFTPIGTGTVTNQGSVN